jgi:hypothetical protein
MLVHAKAQEDALRECRRQLQEERGRSGPHLEPQYAFAGCTPDAIDSSSGYLA